MNCGNQNLLSHFKVTRTETSETIRTKALPVFGWSVLLFVLGAGMLFWSSGDFQMKIYGIVMMLAPIVLLRHVLSGLTLNFETRQLCVVRLIIKKAYSIDDISHLNVTRASDSKKSWCVQACIEGKDPIGLLGSLTEEEAYFIMNHIIEQFAAHDDSSDAQ